VDVYYPASGGARAALVLSGDPAFAEIRARKTALVPHVAPYRPGRFFERELPPLRAVLADVTRIELLVIDGYVDLDPHGRPGLGARLHAELGIPSSARRRPASRPPITLSRCCADTPPARFTSPRPGCRPRTQPN
jgi:hypothetical protein